MVDDMSDLLICKEPILFGDFPGFTTIYVGLWNPDFF